MNHFNLVSILSGMYLVHPSDHADARLSGLLRYMKPFLVQISQTMWEMTVRAAERITHRLWSLLDKVATHLQVCVCVCMTFTVAGHWRTLLTFDPSLDLLTPAWPLCLARTAEQRVSLAWAVDWWLYSLLLAERLDPCVPLHRRTEQAEGTGGSSTWLNILWYCEPGTCDRHSSTWHGKPKTLSDNLFTVTPQHSKT